MKTHTSIAIATFLAALSGCSTPPPPRPAPQPVVTQPEPKQKQLSDSELRAMGVRRVQIQPGHPIRMKGLMPSM